ncbi:Transposase [Caenorhabditis elegans]|uniref:Transposase n=1 Tax=Caenorhabditis elegans TaxID=6239 RepID=Q19112_CAEEL|nr:Transposase [Caenorhabditis elegans]CAA91933.2 Transposase [Caenorhabditis elegans]|eukprot:NP_510246.2 Uncharacterized protein CELE_F02D10.2 [Caenorhabditis elegans]
MYSNLLGGKKDNRNRPKQVRFGTGQAFDGNVSIFRQIDVSKSPTLSGVSLQ